MLLLLLQVQLLDIHYKAIHSQQIQRTMTPMHRLAATLVRSSPAIAPSASSTISRRAAFQAPAAVRTYANGKGTDTTNASGQARDKAQVKNHSEAQQGHDQSAPLSEGVSLPGSFGHLRLHGAADDPGHH